MPYDFKLTTKNVPSVPPIPGQVNAPAEFFGEQSNDLYFGALGDMDQVVGTAKLRQDIQKVLHTARGTHTHFPLYGTELQKMVGQKSDLSYIRAKVKDEIIAGLQILQFVNKENTNPDERIALLESIQVDRPAIDQIYVNVSVITESNKRVTTWTQLAI